MSRHFVPAGPLEGMEATVAAGHSNALVTASYAPDFERCRLLCETIDRHVTGFGRHYILVESRDVALFRQLENARRIVVDERDLLPSWLRPFDDPTSGTCSTCGASASPLISARMRWCAAIPTWRS